MIPYGNHSARSVALLAQLTSHSPKTRRSAVKARLIDPLRESFGEARCAPRGDGVMAFREAITWFEALDHATGCRVDAETVPMRAYVTSGLVPTRTKRHAYALRPHATSCERARWLAAHERREGLRAARTARRRRSRVGLDEGRRRLRCSAGAAAGCSGGNAHDGGGAMVAVVLTGTREGNNTRTTVAPLPLP